MAKEVERKFLVKDDSYRAMAVESYKISQGYLSRKQSAVVRIRTKDSKAFITIKGETNGCTRDEWEYEVPYADGTEMLKMCEGSVIEKTRYMVPYGGKMWEVDEFGGKHSGLVVAEVELESEADTFVIPPFAGEEVTGDARYYNSNL